MAQRSKFTKATREKILSLLRAGNYLETAAAAAGISRTTIRNWLRRGQRGERGYAQFAAQVEQAIAESEAMDVVRLGQLARGSGDQGPDRAALAWRLERRFRGRWGARLALVTEAREEAVEEILARLRERLDPGTFAEVLVALRDLEGGEPVGGEDGLE